MFLRAPNLRRLGQASILCMRELFRTVVNDGDISEENQLVGSAAQRLTAY